MEGGLGRGLREGVLYETICSSVRNDSVLSAEVTAQLHSMCRPRDVEFLRVPSCPRFMVHQDHMLEEPVGGALKLTLQPTFAG